MKPFGEVNPADGSCTVNMKDIRTLPVNDQLVEKQLAMRVLNSKNVEISKTLIKDLLPFYAAAGQLIEIKA